MRAVVGASWENEELPTAHAARLGLIASSPTEPSPTEQLLPLSSRESLSAIFSPVVATSQQATSSPIALDGARAHAKERRCLQARLAPPEPRLQPPGPSGAIVHRQAAGSEGLAAFRTCGSGHALTSFVFSLYFRRDEGSKS